MRWPGESPLASVSPLMNPIRTSLTSGEGDVRAPPFKRKHVVGAWRDAACGRGLGRVPKRGSDGGGWSSRCLLGACAVNQVRRVRACR